MQWDGSETVVCQLSGDRWCDYASTSLECRSSLDYELLRGGRDGSIPIALLAIEAAALMLTCAQGLAVEVPFCRRYLGTEVPRTTAGNRNERNFMMT